MTGRPPAPDLPAALEWVNVEAAPRLGDLRGRVLLLWFLSADSAHCWNLVPALEALGSRFHDGLVVLGIHCPRQHHLTGAQALADELARLGVRHPVASDVGFEAWQAYGIQAWPSIVLVDAEGRLAAVLPGEAAVAEAGRRIASLLDEAAARDLRVFAAPPQPRLEMPDGALAFPAGLAVNATALYVADSGHHRVLECDHSGRIRRVFGSGRPGLADGPAGEAGFRDPRGLALGEDALFVADRGNHAVRRVDLGSGMVSTLLGSGQPGFDRPGARVENISNPLGLAWTPAGLLLTLAGQHQVWRIPPGGVPGRVSGSGEEGGSDGAADTSRFNQPAGITLAGPGMLVTESGGGRVRALSAAGQSATLAPAGGDGPGLEAPAAVVMDGAGCALIADRGRHRLLRYRRGTGLEELAVEAFLDRPEALAVHRGSLWIANTFRHEILQLPVQGGTARRLAIAG